MSAYDTFALAISGTTNFYKLSETVAVSWTAVDSADSRNANVTSNANNGNEAGMIVGDSSTAVTATNRFGQVVGVVGNPFPSGNNPFTLLVWAKNRAGAAQSNLIGWGGPGFNGDNGVGMGWDSTGKLQFRSYSPGAILTAPNAQTANTRYLCGIDWNGAGTARIWENGVNTATRTGYSNLAINLGGGAAFSLLGIGDGTNNGMVGAAQKAQWFNRLLTQAEWTNFYNAGLGIFAGASAQHYHSVGAPLVGAAYNQPNLVG